MNGMIFNGVANNENNDSMDEEDEERYRRQAQFKPKITQDQIDMMQFKQTVDLFEDIADLKSIIKFDYIITKP